jgi:hypothetical protein
MPRYRVDVYPPDGGGGGGSRGPVDDGLAKFAVFVIIAVVLIVSCA